jgi:N-acetyl-gamma-glutamyl-phosphate reductase common form
VSEPIPAVVLGGTGYVAGELLRLLAQHPRFALQAVLSDGSPGEAVAQAFPHLASAYPELRFSSQEEVTRIVCAARGAALFAAAPHGVSAALLDRLLTAAEAAGARPRVVDTSADFRYAAAPDYERVYGHPHASPERLRQFTCAVPEHLAAVSTPHVAHPGCFATAVLLASVPLLAHDLIEPQLFVSGITGSTGSGRKPVPGTHHPLRHGDLYAYSALSHRHVPEILACARAATGIEAQCAFVPHSGPFARGIHVSVQARLRRPREAAALPALLADYYRGAPFVRVSASPPRIKDVAGSNYAHLATVSAGDVAVVMCAIDNLNKGAAGGALQWMNRLHGLPETTGLTAPAAGWT